MSVDLQETIQERVRILSEDELRQVLNFVNGLRNGGKSAETLGELIDECFKDVPPEVMDKLPEDASANLEHYLYNAPKK
ncbi:MAG: queuosine salvage family protein [Acidobacteriota bacterium]|nr:queuosine salvage family protein [Acidobacteriota bacterium]